MTVSIILHSLVNCKNIYLERCIAICDSIVIKDVYKCWFFIYIMKAEAFWNGHNRKSCFLINHLGLINRWTLCRPFVSIWQWTWNVPSLDKNLNAIFILSAQSSFYFCYSPDKPRQKIFPDNIYQIKSMIHSRNDGPLAQGSYNRLILMYFYIS